MDDALGDTATRQPDAMAFEPSPGRPARAGASREATHPVGGAASRDANAAGDPLADDPSRRPSAVVPTADDRTIVSPDGGEVDALVARAARGDAGAFAVLYDEFAPRMYRYVAFRVREPADAEDLVQRVFVKVIEALPRYEQRGAPFSAWLFRLAHNAVIDFARTGRNHAPLDVAAELPADAPDPSELVARAADTARLEHALRSLTPDQQQVVACRFYAGLSVAETARVLGRREIAVRSLQFRALAALRRSLGLAADSPLDRLPFEGLAR